MLTRRTLIAGSVLAPLVLRHEAAEAAEAAASTLTDLGTPINNVAINKSSYSHDGSTVYVATSGEASAGGVHFNVVDVRSGTTRLSLPMPGAAGSWDVVTAPDGSVYVASYAGGRLFRYRPGSRAIDDLGQPFPGAQYLFSLAVAGNGTVFVGEYPTGKLFSYSPRTGAYRDYGQISADSLYLRGLAVWEHTVLVALGSQRAHLYSVDIRAGAKQEIALPAPHNAEREVKRVTVVGDLAYVNLTDSKALLVYDLCAKTWSTAPGRSAGVDVSPPAPNGRVYHVNATGSLTAYQPRTGTSTGIDAFSGMFSSRGFAWFSPGKNLVMIDYIGRLWKYTPATGAHSVALADIPGEPITIRSVGLAPDGRVFASGLGSGGLAVYDPASGAMSQYEHGTVGQADEMLTVGDQVYLGVYPGATLLRFDPAQPFAYGTNPAIVATFGSAAQDRPLGLAAAAGLIVVGTVPAPGQLTGAVSTYDPATGAVFTDRGVVSTHSVVSLVSDGSIVYGSTSKWGGLGVTPPPGDGKVFAYDPVARQKLWEVVPVPGQPAVTELAFSPDGLLWGYTNGALFQLDLATRTVVRTIAVPPENWSTVDHVWSEGQRLAFASDGTIYASVGGQLLQVNPATGSYTQLAQFVHAFVLANDHTLYLARGTNLYRLTL